MQVHFRQGIHLPGPNLWLDPHARRSFAVVTHAHADHVQHHDEVLATTATAAMMRRRGVTRPRFHVAAYREARTLGHSQVTLYPAGHILGSAQVLVDWDGVRLLYSGDFKLRQGLSCEAIEVPQADIVVMETTFGRPRYRFPDAREVCAAIREFCLTTLAEGRVPVLFCYSLGKGQEVLAALKDFEAPIYLHTPHFDMTALYRDLGTDLPLCRKLQPGQKPKGPVLCSSASKKTAWFAALGDVRTAYISGWAIDSSARYRFGVDAAFPLSDHADYDELLEYVRLTGAKTVWTHHGFVDEFARDLRRLGYQAEPLKTPGPQLSLF